MRVRSRRWRRDQCCPLATESAPVEGGPQQETATEKKTLKKCAGNLLWERAAETGIRRQATTAHRTAAEASKQARHERVSRKPAHVMDARPRHTRLVRDTRRRCVASHGAAIPSSLLRVRVRKHCFGNDRRMPPPPPSAPSTNGGGARGYACDSEDSIRVRERCNRSKARACRATPRSIVMGHCLHRRVVPKLLRVGLGNARRLRCCCTDPAIEPADTAEMVQRTIH